MGRAPEVLRPAAWVPVAAALALALVVATTGANRPLFGVFNGLGPATSDALWAFWSLVGEGMVLLVLLWPLLRRDPRLVWSAALAIILGGLAVQAVKFLVHTPRPLAVLGAADHVIGHPLRLRSFPSGHTANAFAAAGTFVLLSARRAAGKAAAVAAALLVGVSRMASGVHWPVDVAGGAAVGWSAAVAAAALSARMRWAWTGRGPRVVGAILLAACLALFAVDITGYPGILSAQRALAAVWLAWGGWEYRKLLLAGRGPSPQGR